MRAYLTLLVLVVLGIGSFAGEIRKGATMEVKPNSIWFQDAARLTHWQELKKSGDAPALTSYQHEVLSHRDAWQFLNQLTVKILSYEPRKNQVNVEMKTPGECWAAHGCWTPMLLCNSYHSCHRLVAGQLTERPRKPLCDLGPQPLGNQESVKKSGVGCWRPWGVRRVVQLAGSIA